MTEYYAIPNGAGGSGSAIYPFRIADAWSVIRPGDTLWLLDGVYTGSNSMIHPPAGVAGTPDARITIKAVNDGKVLIDGEGIQTRPVHLTWSGNDYFTIEGINASNGLNYVIDAGGVGNIFRRCIAWNAIESTRASRPGDRAATTPWSRTALPSAAAMRWDVTRWETTRRRIR